MNMLIQICTMQRNLKTYEFRTEKPPNKNKALDSNNNTLINTE